MTRRSLADLPATPQFAFCATDVAFGVNWIYSRDRAGDYSAGYRKVRLEEIPIAHAAAASACFPPVFNPINTLVEPGELSGGDDTGPNADRTRTKIRLSDGGVYDNMGLEPVWKRVKTLLVSDAGGRMEFYSGSGAIGDVKRYTEIVENQARALRKRWLIEAFRSGNGPGGLPGFEGTYWGTVGYRGKYQSNAAVPGYGPEIAALISEIRTDLDAFTDAEQCILENHGYLMADIAVQTHLPSLYSSSAPLQTPHPEWMDEAKVRVALQDSQRRKLF